MLDPQFIDQPGREDTTSESTTEDGGELRVQTTDTHVLELEVGSQDSIRRSSLRRVLQLDTARGILSPDDLRAFHDDASLTIGTVQGGDGAHSSLELVTTVVKDQRLQWCERQ